MATYTPNYQLHQWVPEDQFLRTDFNEDFKKIDTALAGLQSSKASTSSVSSQISSVNSQISSINSSLGTLQGRLQAVVGQYTGNGASSQTISLGFYPKAVLVEGQHGLRANGYGGLAIRGTPCANGQNLIQITSNGFTVYFSGTTIQTNVKDRVYFYVAFY